MSSTVLSLYVLAWPVLVAGVLAVLVRAFMREMSEARKAGTPMI